MTTSDRSNDWNPHFERKRKRNRVSRGRQKQRRYFAAPILSAIAVVFLWQIGALNGLKLFGRSVAKDTTQLYKNMTSPHSCSTFSGPPSASTAADMSGWHPVQTEQGIAWRLDESYKRAGKGKK